MTANPTVALLGTGTMGAGMAANIAGAGLPLRVWNRTRDKAEPLTQVGATVADTPAEAVRGADVVLTMLFDADSVAATMEQAREGLTPGTVWLQQSTVGVEGSDRLVALARSWAWPTWTPPCSAPAGPPRAAPSWCWPPGPRTSATRCSRSWTPSAPARCGSGPPARRRALKLAANAWVITVVEGIAEALALTRSLGLDPALFLEAVAGGAMDAPYVGVKGRAMLAGDFEPSFAVSGAAKDADLIVAAARGAGVELAVVEAARDHLARALAAGHGDQDLSATYLEH